jgi:hypothetical protein
MTSIALYARRGLWALPVWAVLLFLGTLTHQPPYKTHFAAWTRYVTTDSFLTSHLVNSIGGAAVGMLAFVALAVTLFLRGTPRLATWALATSLIGNVCVVSVFGVAAFGQPAIGRLFLGGDHRARHLYDDVNGTPLLTTALLGVLLLSAGLILFGLGVRRVHLVHQAAGWCLVVGGPLFAIVGVVLADVVQSIGVAILVVGTSWIALRTEVESPQVADSSGTGDVQKADHR